MSAETIWSRKKLDLASKFSWLPQPGRNAKGNKATLGDSVDRAIFLALSRNRQQPYDPFLIEHHVNTVSEALDRCGAYRDEIHQLEDLGFKHAQELDLFRSQFDSLRAIELAEHIEHSRHETRMGQADVASIFDHAEHPLAIGLARSARAVSVSAGIEEDGEQQRKQNIRSKWQALQSYWDEIDSMHHTPGHTWHYFERSARIRSLLIQEIGVAYDKIQAIRDGVPAVFPNAGLNVAPFPQPTESGYLDSLILWFRGLLDELEIKLQSEIEFDHVVYLKQPKATTRNRQIAPRIEVSTWDRNIGPAGTGSFEINLAEAPAEFDRRIFQNLRVRGVSLSLGVAAERDVASARQHSASAVLFPPPAPIGPTNRAPVIFENVRLTEPDWPTRLVSPDSIMNLDPRGLWRVQISPNIGFPDNQLRRRDGDHIRELKLHLRLRAVVSANQADWTQWSA